LKRLQGASSNEDKVNPEPLDDAPDEQFLRCPECQQLFKNSDFRPHFTVLHPGVRINPAAVAKVPIEGHVEDTTK
jgi:hypothetical protein